MQSACRMVESRWAINIVIASRLTATSRMVSLISSSVKESSDEVASSNTSNCGRRRRARAIESRCFSPPETFTPPSPIFNCHLIFRRSVIKDMATLWAVEADQQFHQTRLARARRAYKGDGLAARHAERDFAQGW